MMFCPKELVFTVMQALSLDTTENAEASSEDDGTADDQSDAASSAEDDADINDLDDFEDESDAPSSASGSDEEEDEDEGSAKPSSSAGLAKARVKKQKTGDEASGLGSVGWEASDEEDERPAAVLASGMVLQLCLQIKRMKCCTWFWMPSCETSSSSTMTAKGHLHVNTTCCVLQSGHASQDHW